MATDDNILTEEKRTQLDGIVQKMISNKEPDVNIRAVVEDFKNLHGVKKKDLEASGEGSQLKISGTDGQLISDIYSEYPALKKVYGRQGENLAVKADPNFKASEIGYGDIEFFHKGKGDVNYGNGYKYPSPDKNKYGVLYNPDKIKNPKEAIFLDLLHGMRDDPDYNRLREKFKDQALKDRSEDIKYFYDKDRKEGKAQDGYDQWVDNYVDGLIRSEFSKQTEGEYAEERKYNSPEMKDIADKMKSYLSSPESGFRTMAEKFATVEDISKSLGAGFEIPIETIDEEAEKARVEERQLGEKQERKELEKQYEKLITENKDQIYLMLDEKSKQNVDPQAELNLAKNNLKELSDYQKLNPDEPGVQEEMNNLTTKIDDLSKQKQAYTKENIYLEEAKELLNLADRFLKSDRKGISGLWDAIKRNVVTSDFATIGISKIMREFDILEIANKSRKDEELSPDENALLAAYGLFNEIKGNVDVGIGSEAGESIVAMVPYLITFAATSGAATSVEGFISNLLKVGTSQGMKAMAGKTAAFLTTTGVRTFAFGELYSGFAERRIGQIGVDEEGKAKPIPGTEESFKKALIKSFGTTYSEVLTEQFGERIFSKIGKKFGVNQMAKNINPSIPKKVMSAVAFDGFVSEMGEEFANKILNVAMEGQPFGEIFNMKEFLSTAVTIGVMSGSFQAASLADRLVNRKRLSGQYDNFGSRINPNIRKNIDGILDKDVNADEKAKNLTYILDEQKQKGASQEDIQNIISYVLYKSAFDSFQETEETIQETAEKGEKKAPVTEKKGKGPEVKPEEKVKEEEEKKPEVTEVEKQVEVLEKERESLMDTFDKVPEDQKAKIQKEINDITEQITKLKEEPDHARKQQGSEVRETGHEEGALESERDKDLSEKHRAELRDREATEERVVVSPEGKSREAYAGEVAEISTDPDQLHEVYITEVPPKEKLTLWQDELLKYRVNTDSFKRFSDPNNITKQMQMNWFTSDKKMGIDIMADEISDNTGQQVTPQMIVDFIIDYPGKIKDTKTANQKLIEERYQELMGYPISFHEMKKEAEKEELTDDEISELENLPKDFVKDIEDMIGRGTITLDNIDDLSWLWDTDKEFKMAKEILKDYEKRGTGETEKPEEAGEAPESEGEGKGEKITKKEQTEFLRKIDLESAGLKEFGEKMDMTQFDNFTKEDYQKLINEYPNWENLSLKEKQKINAKRAKEQGEEYEESAFAKQTGPKKRKGRKYTKKKETRPARPTVTQERKKAEEAKKRWIDEEKMTDQALKGIPIPELIQIYKKLAGKFPTLKAIKSALGRFKHIEGSDKNFIEIDYSLVKDPEMLAKVLAHEIGHFIDYIEDKTLARGNILGRIASAKKYMESLLAEKPGKEGTLLTDEDRKRLRRQARAELRSEYNKGIVEIIEEVIEEIPIFEKTGLTAEDVRAIWNDNSSREKFPELYDYIAKLPAKAKANIMKQAIRGIVNEEIAKLGGAKQIGTKKVKTIKKTVKTPPPVTEQNIAERLRELLKEEINKRRLFENEVITEELKALTQWWNPFNEAIDRTYANYRFTSKELYAEALSVMLNNPEAVKERAPYFYLAFLNYMGEKPSFKQVYDEMQDLLNEKREELFKDRRRRTKEAFAKGKEKRKGILDEETKKLGFFQGIGQELFSESIPITQPIKKFTGRVLKKNPTDYQILKNALEKTHFMPEQIGVFLYEIEQNIIKRLEEHGLNIDDFGEILTYERVMYDETRKEKGNPLGYMEHDAAELQAYIYENYTPAQAEVMRSAVHYFHDRVFEIMTAAHELDIINDETFEKIVEPNKDFYATFAIIKYIDKNYISPYLIAVKGTFEEHENPLISTLFKMSSMIKLINRQSAILTMKEIYDKHLPGEMKVVDDVGYKKGMGYIPFKDNGRTRYLEVDKWMAQFFEFEPDQAKYTLKIFKYFHSVWKPTVTTFNMSFAFFSNVFRDSPRTARYIYTLLANTEGVSRSQALGQALSYIGQLAKSMVSKGKSEARKFVDDEMTPLLKEMMEEGAIPTGFFGSYDAYANDMLEPFMAKHNLISAQKNFMERLNEIPVLKSIVPILEFIQYRGSIIEAMPKILAYKIYKKVLGSKELAALYTRNYAGTPNWRDKARITKYVNQIFPFSNVVLQAVRADSNIAVGPATRSSYWTQAAITVMTPAIATAIACLGGFGDDIERMFDAIPDYDKTNYMCIPLGWKKNGKVRYIRIPMDEFSRFIYAITYKASMALKGEFTKPQQVFAVGRGLAPNMSPLVETIRAWTQFAQRENPYDNFYGSNILTREENITRGWKAYKKMLTWSFDNLGGGAVIRMFDYDPQKRTTSEYILRNTPIVKRAYRESDYGLSEIRREEARKEEKKHYKLVEKEDKVINDIVRELIKDDKAKTASVDRFAKIVVFETYTDYEEYKDREKYIKAKLQIKLAKGLYREHTNIINEMYRRPNPQKEVVLISYANQFGKEQANDIMTLMSYYGIISSEFKNEMKRKLNYIYPD